MIYGHGDWSPLREEVLHDFATNICKATGLKGLREHLKEHLRERMELISIYPEPMAVPLREAVAEREGVKPENVACTSGATDAIYTIANLLRGIDGATIAIPTFTEYSDACSINGIEPFYTSSLSECGIHIAQSCWLCNPNNPDGKVWDREELETLIIANPDTIFIIDMSYGKLSRISVGKPKELIRHKNVVTIHSLTKHLGVPGLRIGYVVAHEGFIKALTAIMRPWAISSLGIEAGVWLLDHEENYSKAIKDYLEDSRILEGIGNLNGYKLKPSSTNFYLAECIFSDSRSLHSYLRHNFGIAIREAQNFRGLRPGHFRIAGQTREENLLLLEALKQYNLHYKSDL